MKSQKRKKAEIRRAMNYILPALIACGVGMWTWGTLFQPYPWPAVPPPPAVPTPNAVPVFEQAAAAFASVPANANLKLQDYTPESRKTKAPSLAMVRNAMKTNRSALSLFRKAISMPCQYPAARSWNSPIPLRKDETDLAKFVVLNGKTHEADKDWRTASDSYLDVYEYGIKLGSRSHLINQLIGTMLQSYGTHPLSKLLDRCDEATARHIIQRMSPLYAQRSPAYNLIQEEWYGTITWMNEGIPKDTLKNQAERLLRRQACSDAALYWISTIDWAKTPVFERGRYPVYPTYDNNLLKKFLFASAFAPPKYQSAIEETDKKQTQSQMTLVKAYLALYHLKNGEFPATLEQLALPPGLEIDPYSNAPIHYLPPVKNTLQPRLYSVGINKRDDNGGAEDMTPDSQ